MFRCGDFLRLDLPAVRAFAPDADDVPGAQRGEVLRDDRLPEPKLILEGLHRPRADDEALEDADAGGMGEAAKEIALEDLQRRVPLHINIRILRYQNASATLT